MKPETKFYAQVKRNFTEIQWTRLENLSVPGTPDLLGYNNNCHFFTVELKVTKTKQGYLFSTSNCVPCETSTQYFYLSFRCLSQGSKTL
jgi:hypothetical protein